ncbi:UDP-glucose 4-epimerase GalE [Pendulispora brunnea]|uniref:UDP-glucose 4-epimerase n=1 Tax=Pendulispora brunnea TaxID=2905690 RepID=A0ABZ2KNM5_9BACT
MTLRVLVAGGAGYIGSHTAKALKAAGHLPVVLDDLSTGHEEAVRFGPFVRGSIQDAACVTRAVREHRIDAVLHFAANAYVRESLENPRKYFRNNVANTVHFLDALLEEGVKTIVFSSTCAVYGIPPSLPIVETTPTKPINPYGQSKLMIEDVLRWYGKLEKLSWMALRYFNAAGADPDGELGENHEPETHLIPLLVAAALGQREPVRVFGTTFPTPDGTAVRDYIHVADLATAHVRAVTHLAAGGASESVNLGTGKGTSIREVIASVERATGKPVPVIYGEPSPGDPPILVADPARAHALGHRFEHDLDSIVATAVAWAKKGTHRA